MAAHVIRRNDDFGIMSFERFAEVIGIVGFIRQQAFRRRDIVEQRSCDADVGNVAWRQDEGDRLALSVGQSVDLAGPSATYDGSKNTGETM